MPMIRPIARCVRPLVRRSSRSRWPIWSVIALLAASGPSSRSMAPAPSRTAARGHGRHGLLAGAWALADDGGQIHQLQVEIGLAPELVGDEAGSRAIRGDHGDPHAPALHRLEIGRAHV